MEEVLMEEQAKAGMLGKGEKQIENNHYCGKSTWYQ